MGLGKDNEKGERDRGSSEAYMETRKGEYVGSGPRTGVATVDALEGVVETPGGPRAAKDIPADPVHSRPVEPEEPEEGDKPSMMTQVWTYWPDCG